MQHGMHLMQVMGSGRSFGAALAAIVGFEKAAALSNVAASAAATEIPDFFTIDIEFLLKFV